MIFAARPFPLVLVAIFCYLLLTSHFGHFRQQPQDQASDDVWRDSKAEGSGTPRASSNVHPSDFAELLSSASATAKVTSIVASATSASSAVETVGAKTTSGSSSSTEAAASSSEEFASATSPVHHLQTSLGVDVKEYMADILKWEPPKTDEEHWPPYDDFRDKDYDPNRWEGFPSERGYYLNSGVNQLSFKPKVPVEARFLYPQYESEEYQQKWYGEFNPCEGPSGRPVQENHGDVPRAYNAAPKGMPLPFTGSAEALGMSTDICLDRVQRYGPYSHNLAQSQPSTQVDWTKAHWGHLQDKCVEANKGRWAPNARKPPVMTPDFETPMEQIDKIREIDPEVFKKAGPSANATHQQYHPRTAVLIRTWEGYDYAQNDIVAVRSMVTELSLATGGEYQVFLFVNIKNRGDPIYEDSEVYQAMLERFVPEELRDIAILWNEDAPELMYPNVTDWQVYWHQFMPVQWFSETHPEFDYIWNWEMDVRYIGNHYQFLSKVGDFAQKQPRKYLWERNARYYIPNFHGQNYTEYQDETNAAIANASAAGLIDKPIWGALPYNESQKPLGPTAPWSQEEDNFEWGVGENADLVTLLPIWDPEKTQWTMRNKIWNFTPDIHPIFNDEHPTDDGHDDPSYRTLPRRAYINTVVRFSRRLLHAMHAENLAGRSMQAEMWPTTVALHHGFKAVYAPNPIYSGVQWPARYADAIFNADGGVPARWGQQADSVYNQDREVNFRSWSWYYHAQFPSVLWRRWMGWRAGDDALGDEVGGLDWEEEGGSDGPMGRICLPPMLLHPVKRWHLDF